MNLLKRDCTRRDDRLFESSSSSFDKTDIICANIARTPFVVVFIRVVR